MKNCEKMKKENEKVRTHKKVISIPQSGIVKRLCRSAFRKDRLIKKSESFLEMLSKSVEEKRLSVKRKKKKPLDFPLKHGIIFNTYKIFLL